MNLKTRLLARLGQRLEEVLAIHIVQENDLAPVSAAQEVVSGPRGVVRNNIRAPMPACRVDAKNRRWKIYCPFFQLPKAGGRGKNDQLPIKSEYEIEYDTQKFFEEFSGGGCCRSSRYQS